MTDQQGLRQASVRAVTGTTLDYNGDFMALFALAGITSGDFNGQLLAWINLTLSANYDNLPGAMAAFAIANNATNFASVGTFNASTAPKFIIDTDITGDCDDTLAIGIALAAHKAGTIKIVGFIVSSKTPTSAPGLYGLLSAYGLQSIPVYAYQGAVGTYNDNYTTQLRDRFGVAAQTRTAYTDDLTGYRTLVAANPGVTIVGIGAPVALSRFLSSSADGISALTGLQLITANVTKAVQMAGNFPTGTAEYNATRDIASTQNVATNWPSTVPFVWTGGEIGGTVYSMPPLDADPLVDPIRYAYDVYGAAQTLATGRRSSWDPLAVYYAIYGLGTIFTVAGANGSVAVDGTGVTTWSATAGPHSYLGKAIADDRIANQLDNLIDAFIMPARSTITSFIMPLTEGTGQTVTSQAGNVKGVLASGSYTETNDPVWKDLGGGNWVLTSGTGKVITLPPNPGYDSANIVGAAVVNLTSVAGTSMLLAMYDLGPNAKFMFRNNAGKVNFIGYTAVDGTTNFNVSTAAVQLVISTWTLVSFEIIGTSLTMYVNGVSVYTGTVSGSLYVGNRIIRPSAAGRFNAAAISDGMQGDIMCFGMKAGASAGDHTALETSLRAIATAKGITLP